MAATSQQQIVSQSSVLFKFEIPSYDDYGGVGRVFNKENLNSLTDTVTKKNTTGDNSPFAGLLGPSSKAPKLVPNSIAPIDIKSDFAWTSSKADPARADMPYVYLIEKVVDRSSRLQNLLYGTVSLLQSPLGIATGAAAGAGAGAEIARMFGIKSGLGQTVFKLGGAAAGGGAVNYLSDAALVGLGDKYTENLKAFSGLYSTTPTNFSYKLPFVKIQGSLNKKIAQSWSEESSSIGDTLENINQKIEGLAGSASSGLVGSAARKIETLSLIGQAADEANKIANEGLKSIFSAAYTESAKTFTYGNTPSFDISFYLFNNLTWADTVKNWYAVFALQYQNLPNRLNRLILNPSVIYEAVVPGYFYSMYTYIKDINVTYLGSNLLIDIPIIKSDVSVDAVKNISNKQAQPIKDVINVTVPEVYKVEISFESLVPESQNLLYEAMVQSRSNGPSPKIAGVINSQTLDQFQNLA